KEAIDWLRTERTHRLDLRRRYFDAKLDATVRVSEQIKTGTSVVRAFTKLVKENEDSGGWIHPALLNMISNSFGKSGEQLNQDAAGMTALLGFYYDEDVARLAETGGGAPTPLLQKFSEFMFRLEKITEAQNMLNAPVPPPDEVKDIAQKTIRFHEKELKANVGELAKLADAFDELANRLVRRTREDFKDIRF